MGHLLSLFDLSTLMVVTGWNSNDYSHHLCGLKSCHSFWVDILNGWNQMVWLHINHIFFSCSYNFFGEMFSCFCKFYPIWYILWHSLKIQLFEFYFKFHFYIKVSELLLLVKFQLENICVEYVPQILRGILCMSISVQKCVHTQDNLLVRNWR